VLQQQARLAASFDEFLKVRRISPEMLEEKNIFIACEADEDLPYLTKVLGENTLVTGTDYGHNDVGSEIGAHSVIALRSDIDRDVARKIVDTNGRRLLGVDASPTPARYDQSTVDPPNVRGAATTDGRPILTGTPV
jgi:hypothetical protein